MTFIPCESRTEYFHEAGVTDDKLAPLMNRLAKEHWLEIECEKEQAEKEIHIPTTYRVDAQREVCMCKLRKKRI